MTDIFPFFVGCGRSGTTLLRSMFDSHPYMAVPPESYFVVAMGERRQRYERSGRFSAGRFASELLTLPPFLKWGLPGDVLLKRLAQREPSSYPDAVREVFALYAELRGKGRFADKTPAYVAKIPLIASIFDEAKFVHIVRDGRDVALSLVSVSFGPATVPDAASYWRRMVTSGREGGAALGGERYAEIRYEDLINDPEYELRSLATFLDLPFDRKMLTYFDHADEVRAGVNPQNHPHIDAPLKRYRDWRTDMSIEDLTSFEAVAGDILSELGYERATDVSLDPVVGMGASRRVVGADSGSLRKRLSRRAHELRWRTAWLRQSRVVHRRA